MDKYWHSRLNSSMLRVAAAQKKDNRMIHIDVENFGLSKIFGPVRNFRTGSLCPKFSAGPKISISLKFLNTRKYFNKQVRHTCDMLGPNISRTGDNGLNKKKN